MLSITKPPSVLCLRMSTGRLGREAGSLDNVSCEPIVRATRDAKTPSNGPETAKSNIWSLFFGRLLKVVTELVIPVTNEGTRVGADTFIFGVQGRKVRGDRVEKAGTSESKE